MNQAIFEQSLILELIEKIRKRGIVKEKRFDETRMNAEQQG
jgi:hypothetical protein